MKPHRDSAIARAAGYTLALMTLAPALSAAPADDPLPRGSWEVELSGTAYVPHDIPADTFGVAIGRFGRYLARNQEVGVDATLFAYSQVEDLYLSGFYRYVFARPGHRLAPFAGAAAGANVARFSNFGSEQSFIAKAEGGLRIFVGGRFAFDVSYNYMYRRKTEFGFTGTNSSILTFGFAKTF